MAYFYALLWLVIGLVLLFSFSKENKVFIVAGLFFLLLGGWWLANTFTETDLFAGTWGIVLRCITGAALAVFAYVFVKEYRKGLKNAEDAQNKGKKGE